jgi:hypothetical protein
VIGVTLTGANVHDKWMVGETLDAMVVSARAGPVDRRTSVSTRATTMTMRKLLFVRAASSLTFDGAARSHASGKRGRPPRGVGERANSWHKTFRALRIRWETKATHYVALVHMACALIAYRAANAEKRTPVLIVAVSVALAVGASVSVAALGNGNDIVKVIDAGRRSRIDELREHGHDALEQVDAALVQRRASESAACQRYRPLPSQVASSFTGLDHGHGIVPAHERGHHPGRDHGHGHGVSHRF